MPHVHGFNGDAETLEPSEGNKLSKDSSKEDKLNSSTSKNIPIIKKSGICHLLAELVTSYPQCARLITDYSFHAGDSELVSEVSIYYYVVFSVFLNYTYFVVM